jgi:hypothetical protein
MGELLGQGGAAMGLQSLYRCLDKLLEHKQAMFGFLTERWRDLFQAGYDVLLYDLTSTYFECVPAEGGTRRHGLFCFILPIFTDIDSKCALRNSTMVAN